MSTTLSGRVTFESVPSTNGALDYAASQRKPARGVLVDIVDNVGRLRASTTTDANGRYSVTVTGSAVVAVQVKAQLTAGANSGSAGVAVRDNTQYGALYGVEVGDFPLTGTAITRDIDLPSGWTGSRYGSERFAAPFAVLDAVYTAQAKVLAVAPDTRFPALTIYWSPDNRPALGQPALGQITSSHFTDGTRSGGERSIYVLGKENVDTDEYDSSVIVHEWGHYYQSAFSRSDSPGGPHYEGELLDSRLAFSEGWGNAWSGIALGRSDYSDSAGERQATGASVALDSGPSTMPGWYNERSVQSVLWRLNDGIGFLPIHQAMTQGLRTTPAVTSIHSFAAAFNAVASASQRGVLDGLLVGQRITGSSDPFGGTETNDGGLGAFALPLYTTAAVNTPQRVCVTNSEDPYREGNKLGSYAFLRVALPQARSYTVSVTGPAGSDPDFVVYQGARVGGSAKAAPAQESGSVVLSAGTAVVAVHDYENSSANTCFVVTIN